MTHLAVISEPLKGLLDEDIVCHGQVLCGGGAVGFVVLLVGNISLHAIYLPAGASSQRLSMDKLHEPGGNCALCKGGKQCLVASLNFCPKRRNGKLREIS